MTLRWVWWPRTRWQWRTLVCGILMYRHRYFMNESNHYVTIILCDQSVGEMSEVLFHRVILRTDWKIYRRCVLSAWIKAQHYTAITDWSWFVIDVLKSLLPWNFTLICIESFCIPYGYHISHKIIYLYLYKYFTMKCLSTFQSSVIPIWKSYECWFWKRPCKNGGGLLCLLHIKVNDTNCP